MKLSDTRNFVVRTTVFATALSAVAVDASAEPPSCYVGRPAVLPAPTDYGTAYPARRSTAVYADPPVYTSYRRTYSSPAYRCESARGVPVAQYDRPVVPDTSYYAPAYETTYYAPRRVVRLTSLHHYGRRSHHRYYGDHYYRPRHVGFSVRYARHGHHRGQGHRRWGFSVGLGLGHHRRHGGFSFHYSRRWR